jgi:uncharacterized RDD family membrane protein YckC
MDHEREWHRVKNVFQAALDQPAAARTRFVREACGDDAALLARVESLLAAHDQAGGFAERPAEDVLAESPVAARASDDDETRLPPPADRTGPAAPVSQASRVVPGQNFGPYHIVRLLGRGGMGEVYEAQHLEQGRRVAVKVLHHRLASRDERERFLREGQLAASITHPHVVYVFGSEEIAGIPIIAMELAPGGTLKDRVRERGPLAPVEAVDAILQVIAGLDAAQAAGVLHRDVKPANCFVDRDGVVKVGDFGLSISTGARDATDLTETGVVLGTPQFAAPEQLRGQALDVRTDIYAAGATLYYLLTGHPPFEGRDLLALLTQVATESPRSPHAIVPTVPRALGAIVLRCLAKDPSARPATYAALSEALRPFSSIGPTAATLASRVAAGLVDSVLVWTASRIVVSVVAAVMWGDLRIRILLSGLTAALIGPAYYVLTEGLTGASVGKRLFGLRVTDAHGGRPGPGRVLARYLLFRAGALVLEPARLFFEAWIPVGPSPRAGGSILPYVRSVFRLLGPLANFATARTHNGFAGLHELVSGTRVIAAAAQPTPASRTAPTANAVPSLDASATPRRGPFLLLERLPPTPEMWLGFDPVLKRRAWIRDLGLDQPLSDAARRDLARPARLRWLAGQHGSTGGWEAFEAPQGGALVSLSGPQPWRDVRQWIADLADELAHAEHAGEAHHFGLGHVWITAERRAMLLDFPAPGSDALSGAEALEGRDGSRGRPQALLERVARSALQGRIGPAPVSLPMTRPPLPPSARALLDACRDPKAGIDDVLALSRLALQAPTAVPRLSRALAPALIAITLGGYVAAIESVRLAAVGSGYSIEQSPDQALYKALMAVERLERSGVPESDPDRRALEIYITRGLTPRTSRGPQRLAREVAARHSSISDTEFIAAAERLGPERLRALHGSEGSSDAAISALLFLTIGLLPNIASVVSISLLLAVLFRGGLVPRVLRLAFVDSAGREITRARALWRALLAWMPLLGLVLLADQAVVAFGRYPGAAWTAVGVLGLTMLIGTCWAIVVPERGLHDRIAGTWLVPR